MMITISRGTTKNRMRMMMKMKMKMISLGLLLRLPQKAMWKNLAVVGVAGMVDIIILPSEII